MNPAQQQAQNIRDKWNSIELIATRLLAAVIEASGTSAADFKANDFTGAMAEATKLAKELHNHCSVSAGTEMQGVGRP